MSTNDISMIHNQDEVEAESSLTPPTLVLSFGNILQKFPEFLLHILPFIRDRIVWNSIVSSNKKIYEKTKSKTYISPWPMDFKLRLPNYNHGDQLINPVWSPDGTQIACIVCSNAYYCNRIVIFDQRRGLLRFRRHGDNDNDNDNEIGWCHHGPTGHAGIPMLRFSPDGSFLVSAGEDGFVKLWNYNSTDGYYQQLQGWNIKQELNLIDDYSPLCIDVSPCSRYVVVLLLRERHVILKDVQKNGKTIKSVLLPENESGNQIMFSAIDGQHSIFIRSRDIHNKSLIKIWRPYAVIDEDVLNTIREQPHTGGLIDDEFALSRDNSMIAYAIGERNAKGGRKDRVMLYHIDNDNNSSYERKLTLKQSFSARAHCSSIQFTPDGKYFAYVNEDGLLVFWNIITERDITDQINISYNNKNVLVVMYLSAVNFSPACSGRRFLVRAQDLGYYIASFWESSDFQNNRKQQQKTQMQINESIPEARCAVSTVSITMYPRIKQI